MRKFLIIGAAGTVGSYLMDYLKEKGEEAKGVDIAFHDERFIDILDPMSIEKCFYDHAPTHVILGAAAVGRVFNEIDQHNSVMVNIVGAFNVVRACLKHECKLTYTGTSESYGNRFFTSRWNHGVIDEINVPLDFPGFQGIYGLTKLMAEKLIQHYAYNGGLEYSIARLFMCYAPHGSETNNKVAISRMMISAIHNKPIEVHKNTSRAWCYVSDIVEGIYLVAVKGNRLYNIGNPNEYLTAVELATKIIKVSGSKSTINVCNAPGDIYPEKYFNISLAEDELGFKPKVTLNQGLKWVYQAMAE